MNQYTQLTYLVTFSHLRSLKSSDKNILLRQLKEKSISLNEFFSYDYETLTTDFMLTDKQANSLIISKKERKFKNLIDGQCKSKNYCSKISKK